MMNFKNTYTQLPSNFYARSNPASFSNPSLVAFNQSLAKDLGIEFKNYSEDDLSKIFSGQKILDGSDPVALAYAGIQFGHPVPILGDGRAHLLGEINDFDIQLKGSGQTPFSRRGDGRSSLGPVLREYIVSEAMHSLGVPTTRALAAVRTGEEVYRMEGPEPGGIFTRVADSHIRVGTFQYFAFQKDNESLKALLEYTIKRHYPEIINLQNDRDKSIELLKLFIEKQAKLISNWLSLGFVHGVMNTDNFSLAGITIDYGPCAFMEEFSFDQTFSSIDRNGRYSYSNQIPIAKWNILRLADCLIPLIDTDQEVAIKIIEDEVLPLFPHFEKERDLKFAQKLGLQKIESDDDLKMISIFLNYLEKESLDFTLAFRHLPELHSKGHSFYPQTDQLADFLGAWKNRVKDVSELNSINPIYIPRNHQIQKAIDLAFQGDDTHFAKLNQVFQDPFTEQSENQEFSQPAKPHEVVCKTYCGT